MKKISTLIFLLLGCAHLHAQWNVNWSDGFQHTTLSGYSNEGRYVVSDALGNVYTLTDATSNLDIINHPTGVTHYYVVLKKYDFAGSLINTAQIEVNNMQSTGFDFKSAFSLQIDASSNLYVGYSTYNVTTFYDIGVTKYNSSLVQQWQKTYPGNGNESGVDMVVNGGIAYCAFKKVLGANTTYGLIKLDNSAGIVTPIYSFDANLDVVTAIAIPASPKTIYATGSRLVGAAKVIMTAAVNAGGGLKYKTLFNNGTPTGDDTGSDIVIGSDNNIYVVGTTYISPANGFDGIVVRYMTTSGLVQGYVPINLGSTTDAGAFIANGPAGFLFASCSNPTKASVSKISLSPFGTTNTAIYSPAPLNPFTSITKVTINQMKVAATSNNVYLTGGVLAVSAAGNFNASFLAKYGQNGFLFKMLNFQPVVGEFATSEEGVSLALDPTHNNNILWLRNTWSNYTTHNSERVFIDGLAAGGPLRMQGEQTDAIDGTSIQFYPNPAKDAIYISASQAITKVEIIDALGKLNTTLYPTADNRLDISNLPPGVYFAKAISESGSTVKRIVIK